ncbi:MAG: hypothetical protein JRE47_10150 [Deltaproteobacteria bacterium]|nr:hypothetical protein [Deltaproteobacteria bacterium]
MILEDIKQIATGQILDRDFTSCIKVKFFFHAESGKTIVLHDDDFYAYQTPPAIDSREALWLLKNHPSSGARFIEPYEGV